MSRPSHPVQPSVRPVQAPRRREEARTPKLSRRTLAVLAGVVALAVLVAAALTLRGGSDASDPVALAGGGEIAGMLAGIPQAGTTLGDPQAPVTLVEYADLQCPYCAAWATDALPTLVADYVRTGDLKIEFRGLAFVGADSDKALRFALAAGAQGKLWQAVELLYRNQGHENTGWVSDELLAGAASTLGLDAAQLDGDTAGDRVGRQLETAAAQARAEGVDSTPTVFVGPSGGRLERLELTTLGPESVVPALEEVLADTR